MQCVRCSYSAVLGTTALAVVLSASTIRKHPPDHSFVAALLAMLLQLRIEPGSIAAAKQAARRATRVGSQHSACDRIAVQCCSACVCQLGHGKWSVWRQH
jgi:hypothetical protein